MAVLMIVAVLLTLVVGTVIVWLVPRLVGLFEPLLQRARRSMRARAEASGPKRGVVIGDGLLRRVLAVWSVIVLVYLFIPIGLVFLHSFNRGGSFTIWSNAVSTKWWGELFDGGVVMATALRFAVFIAAAIVAKWLLGRRQRQQPTGDHRGGDERQTSVRLRDARSARSPCRSSPPR
ncbi:MAG: hypothetical protein EB132_07425 [Actinobacteria bacterium]|nr:hypothetical protein [Actinomycetota bacterium]